MKIDTKSERFRAALGAYQRTFTAGHADALAAALEAWEANKPDPWRPIEEAPNDDSWVLVCPPGWPTPWPAMRVRGTDGTDMWFSPCESMRLTSPITRFHPLPPPPPQDPSP